MVITEIDRDDADVPIIVKDAATDYPIDPVRSDSEDGSCTSGEENLFISDNEASLLQNDAENNEESQ